MMTFDMTKSAVLAALIAATPLVTFAQIGAGDRVGTTEEEIRVALTAAGAEILEIERDDDEIEVEYRLNGQIFELEVAEATGIVMEVELEEEEYGEDDDDDDDD